MAINFPNSPSVNDTHVVGNTTYTWNGTSWSTAISSPALELDDLADVVITTPSDDQFLRYNGTEWVNETVSMGSSGTVTSVAMTVPTGLTITGSPITSSGSLDITMSSGYTIPTTAEESNWNLAYGWGDHSTEGYLTTLSLDGLSDAVITTAASGDILSYNGTDWVNLTTLTGNYTFSGNVTFNGTTTYVNTTELNIGDNIIVLNADETSTPSQSAGIEIERGTETNATLLWNETDDRWEANGEEILTRDKAYSPINEVSTSSTLALTDAGDFLKCTNETAITITIPLNSAVAFATGTEIIITQYGTGDVIIAPDSEVAMNSLDGNDQIAGQYGSATLKKIGTDEWILVGALTASA